MQIIDLPDETRMHIVRSATPEDSYVIVPASIWDDLIADASVGRQVAGVVSAAI